MVLGPTWGWGTWPIYFVRGVYKVCVFYTLVVVVYCHALSTHRFLVYFLKVSSRKTVYYALAPLVYNSCLFTSHSPNLLAAWQPGDWNQGNEPLSFDLSPLSPPVTPRPLDDTLLSDIPPFETFYDSLPSESTLPLENTQLFEEVVSGKRSKRELSKKCRKVYGIDNKKSWCTQCRWKKACTRFNS